MPTSTITAISLILAFLKLMFSGQTFETSFTINKCISLITWTGYPAFRKRLSNVLNKRILIEVAFLS